MFKKIEQLYHHLVFKKKQSEHILFVEHTIPDLKSKLVFLIKLHVTRQNNHQFGNQFMCTNNCKMVNNKFTNLKQVCIFIMQKHL